MVIYCIRNLQTGTEYIGSSVRSVERRWSDHMSACFTKLRQSPLYDDMRSIGIHNFELTTLECVDDYELMVERERFLIQQRNTLRPNGYNVVKGGRGNLGWKPSLETRAKMGIWQIGRKLPKETLAKMSAAIKGKPQDHSRQRGRTPWNKGKFHSDATKALLKEQRKSPACRAQMSLNGKSHIGRKRSDETRLRISEVKKLWWASLSVEAKVVHIEKMAGGHK